jgi:2-dehydro-3-deoxyphosphogluconate aldolase/(4S)-4-hydroxy-2-oxoglutarate aldolase
MEAKEGTAAPTASTATQPLLASLQPVAVLPPPEKFPGALTPTEVMHAWEAHSDFVKVVPCAQIGGEGYVTSLHRMFPYIPLIAAGGVSQKNASKFIFAGATALGIGRELLPSEALRLRQAGRISNLAQRFLSYVKSGREH